MRAWICVLDAPSCYECTVRAERKSTPVTDLGFLEGGVGYTIACEARAKF